LVGDWQINSTRYQSYQKVRNIPRRPQVRINSITKKAKHNYLHQALQQETPGKKLVYLMQSFLPAAVWIFQWFFQTEEESIGKNQYQD